MDGIRVNSPTERARADRLAVRFLGSLALAALGFLTLLTAIALAGGPHWENREYALFALPAAFFLGALANAIPLLHRRRSLRKRHGRWRTRFRPFEDP